MLRNAAPWLVAALVGLVGMTLPGAASQAASLEIDPTSIPDPDAYESLRSQGREAYNVEQYDRAETYYIEAIQAAPDEPEAYLDLARTFFWRDMYATAVAYYDFYIQQSDEEDISDKVTSERRLAASRSGDQVWKVPDSQTRILESLRTRLNEGEAYTSGGGGAWGLYRALLRTDYAHPDLIQVRNRLRSKLLEEFDARLQPESGEPTPQLSLSQWKRQIKRLEAARKLTRDEDVRQRIQRRGAITKAATALLNGRHRKAAEASQRAVESHPERTFLKWFHVSALVQANRHDRAQQTLERYSSELESMSDGDDYLEVLQSTLAHRRGNLEQAVDLYDTLLQPSE